MMPRQGGNARKGTVSARQLGGTARTDSGVTIPPYTPPDGARSAPCTESVDLPTMLDAQIALVSRYVDDLAAQHVARYESGSPEWAASLLRLAYKRDLLVVLEAVREGRTVPQS